ncbi:MAG: queuosine salvage family protein [Solirubrobacteraceae bacterium]
MGLCDDVRRHCAELCAAARWVTVDAEALGRFDPFSRGAEIAAPGSGGEDGLGGPAAGLDRECHFLEGAPEAVAAYMLALDTINFGSGWFPTLRKRRGCSGYTTIAWALADRFREDGAWSNGELRALEAGELGSVLGQPADHELVALYAEALRALGRFLGERTPLELVAAAEGSAERLAEQLAGGMAMFADRGFYKRAQIAAADLALAGVAEFRDLDRLTIFADNLVPHVLRCEGVLVYEAALAEQIDGGRLLPPGPQEREIRAAAVHACELLSARLGVPPRVLDRRLWNRGQDPAFKARPRHRCRCVWY